MGFLDRFNFLKKNIPITPDKELVNPVGLTDFWVDGGIKYNPDVIALSTYERMSNHYQVAACLAIISFSIQQIDWFIKTDDAEVKKVLTYAMDKIWNKLIRSVTKSFIYGYSPNTKVFTVENIDGKDYYIYKKIKDLNPANCEVIVDKFGNFNGFKYATSDQNIKIKPEYAFWYVSQMENGNQYGKSLLKNVYKPWWFSEKVHTFANRYYERFGEPLVLGRYPSGSKVKDSNGNTVDANKAMDEVVSKIRSHSSSVMPSDRNPDTKEYEYTLEYLESQMRGYDFEGYLSRLDREISLGLFLPSLLYGGSKGGSYALGNTQTDIFYTNLMGLMDNIVDYVEHYLLPQLIEYNFDKKVNVKFAYQPLSSDSKKNINELVQLLIKEGIVKPDINQIQETSGIKLEEIERKEQIPDKKIEEKILEHTNKLKSEFYKNIEIAKKEAALDKELEDIKFIKNNL